MNSLRVTRHAIERYRERVACLDDREVCRRLNSSAVRCAAAIGAPFVRLPGGQRIVIVENSIVTVLPRGQSQCRLSSAAQRQREAGHD